MTMEEIGNLQRDVWGLQFGETEVDLIPWQLNWHTWSEWMEWSLNSHFETIRWWGFTRLFHIHVVTHVHIGVFCEWINTFHMDL